MAESGAASDQWRDHQALARFETFLFSAVATVLVIRALLAVAGYPQVGGNSGLHVAHVLWGGLLMGTAILAMEIFPGTLVRLMGALLFWRDDKNAGIGWLQRAVLIQLLIVQLVLFNRTQWLGLVGFALDLIGLSLLKLVSRADGRAHAVAAKPA